MLHIVFPNHLCVHHEGVREKFIYCLNYVQQNHSYINGVAIDLRHSASMSASGALAFFAEVTSAQILSKNHECVHIMLPEDANFRKTIINCGLWNAVKPGTKRKLEKLWETNSSFQSGYDPDRHLEPTLMKLESEITIPHRLKEAINEAILNIVQHAYAETKGSVTRWWQYASLNKDKTSFIFAICDKGNTIPHTMGKIRHARDAELIKEAMIEGVSSTKNSWRGKGSKNIKKPVEHDEKDLLIILSRKGIYRYVSLNQEAESINSGVPFNGTLIAWKFNLC